MNLNIIFEKFELYYDVLVCNIIHFFIKNGYFFISSSLYLDEDDPYLELPEFEMDDQANSKQGGLKKIIFENNKINIFINLS